MRGRVLCKFTLRERFIFSRYWSQKIILHFVSIARPRAG